MKVRSCSTSAGSFRTPPASDGAAAGPAPHQLRPRPPFSPGAGNTAPKIRSTGVRQSLLPGAFLSVPIAPSAPSGGVNSTFCGKPKSSPSHFPFQQRAASPDGRPCHSSGAASHCGRAERSKAGGSPGEQPGTALVVAYACSVRLAANRRTLNSKSRNVSAFLSDRPVSSLILVSLYTREWRCR